MIEEIFDYLHEIHMGTLNAIIALHVQTNK